MSNGNSFNDIATIGKILSDKRKEASLSKYQMSDKMQVSYDTITRYEDGSRFQKTIEFLELIETYYGCSAIDLLFSQEKIVAHQKSLIINRILSELKDLTPQQKNFVLQMIFLLKKEVNNLTK